MMSFTLDCSALLYSLEVCQWPPLAAHQNTIKELQSRSNASSMRKSLGSSTGKDCGGSFRGDITAGAGAAAWELGDGGSTTTRERRASRVACAGAIGGDGEGAFGEESSVSLGEEANDCSEAEGDGSSRGKRSDRADGALGAGFKEGLGGS